MRFIVFFLLFSAGIHAELRQLTPEEFEADGVWLSPSLTAGADATSSLARYGVFLSSYPSGTPVIRPWSPSPPIPVLPPVYPCVTNETAGDQAESVLIIDFRRPVRKVGLCLVEGDPSSEVRVRAAGPSGEILGALTRLVGAEGAFIGIEAVDGQPISKVALDFGSAELPEKLAALIVEQTTPFRFETVFPQIAHGRLGGDLLLRTRVTVVNVANTTALGEIRFFSSDGQPLSGAVAPISLYEGRSHLFTTTGAATVVGYARVMSDQPVQALASFEVLEDDRLRAETAVESVEGRFKVVGAYEHQAAPVSGTVGPSLEPSRPSTALAMVNLGDSTATVWLKLHEAEGAIREEQLQLVPGQQIARFIDEIFEEMEDSKGTLAISSSTPVAAILIKTINALPVSILPFGSLEDR